ncbi:MAG: DNA-3-methyladenine glycosylase 2 family protein [Cellvibrionaceae bacterium]
MMTSDIQQWQQARLSRDPRFDGAFYIGVVTTGIFCRPICPARLPKEENIRYLNSASLAIEQGFRPCRRCRPEYSPAGQQQWPDERIDCCTREINAGFLDAHTTAELAEKVALSERQLRRLFVELVGVTPSQMAETRRLLQAKQLLCESNLSITDVALASGFSSIRRFNSAIKLFYRQTPTEIRQKKRRSQTGHAGQCQIEIPHRDDYPWQQVLSFYQQRAIDGMEKVHDEGFSRTLSLFKNPILIKIEKVTKKNALRLTISGAEANQITRVLAFTRQVLDLNTNHAVVSQWLRKDSLLKKLIKPSDRLALPGAWNAFEYLVRAIIGQQVSVKAAKTLTTRIIHKFGKSVDFGEQDYFQFPSAEKLAQADLSGLGLTHRRIETIRSIAQAQVNGSLYTNQNTDLVALKKSLLAIKGIGPWTVDYLLMRGYFQPDIWLDTDLGVINAFKKVDESIDKKHLRNRAENWSPWRSYAVLALWRTL